MKNIYTILIGAIAVIALGTGIYAVTHENQVAQVFGATASNPGANALYESSLASPLGTADAQMFVTSGADVQGNLLPVGSIQALTVDTGQPNAETILGTVSVSSASGLTLNITTRGLNTSNGTTSNSSFIFTHRRGADVRITDFPSLTIINNQLNGVQSIPNLLQYANTVLIGVGSPTTTLATKYYVDQSVASGCGNATESNSGCVQLATGAQAAAGTSAGSTGARLVIPNSLATSTPYTSTPQGSVPSSASIGGKISQLWLDLTQYFSFSNLQSASTTLTGTTNIYGTAVLPANTTVGGATVFKFGGSGVNGALNISSGTTTINLLDKQVFILNYTSISITGTGALAFSNENPQGTLIIIKSQGNVTISDGDAIDASGMGSLSGNNGFVFFGNSFSTTTASAGGGTSCSPTCTAIGGGGGGNNTATSSAILDDLSLRTINLAVGSAGGSSEEGTAGGRGGGALYLEVGGAWNFTGSISVAGIAGANGASSITGSGGGGGGSFLALYNSLTANTGSINISGGVGGSSNNGGAAGGTAGNSSTTFGNGFGGTGGSAGGGGGIVHSGGGGGGSFFQTQNGGAGNTSSQVGSGGGGASGIATTTQNYFFQ